MSLGHKTTKCRYVDLKSQNLEACMAKHCYVNTMVACYNYADYISLHKYLSEIDWHTEAYNRKLTLCGLSVIYGASIQVVSPV